MERKLGKWARSIFPVQAIFHHCHKWGSKPFSVLLVQGLQSHWYCILGIENPWYLCHTASVRWSPVRLSHPFVVSFILSFRSHRNYANITYMYRVPWTGEQRHLHDEFFDAIYVVFIFPRELAPQTLPIACCTRNSQIPSFDLENELHANYHQRQPTLPARFVCNRPNGKLLFRCIYINFLCNMDIFKRGGAALCIFDIIRYKPLERALPLLRTCTRKLWVFHFSPRPNGTGIKELHDHWIVCQPPPLLRPAVLLHWTAKRCTFQQKVIARPVSVFVELFQRLRSAPGWGRTTILESYYENGIRNRIHTRNWRHRRYSLFSDYKL